MESVLHRIRFSYAKFGPGEKKIADFVLANPTEAVGLTVDQLSEKCACGTATAVRFARELGYSGYQTFRLGLAGDLKGASSVGKEITSEDSVYDIFQKHAAQIEETLRNTESVLDPAVLEACAKEVMNARRIVIFGLGNSASVALDAAHKFLRLGLNAQSCSDNHLQSILASHLDKGSLAIGISHSGASKDIVDALYLARLRHARTVAVTNYASSPITEAADYTLFTQSSETEHSILAFSSRIAQLAIFDAIYSYIVVTADRDALRAIYNTEAALQEKKILLPNRKLPERVK